ncbi:MAG TPA: transglycosylase domain-containing protein, partial [Candidatus Nitrosopolaris sp.]|nr:transglycosylase domain-containing protein [Candidatus Nitrosopolaris sp.]
MAKPSPGNRPRRPNSRYITTRSGKVLKINRSMGERWMAMKEGKTRRKAERLRGLPKSRLKRFIWRLSPRRLASYWFSRDGGIMALKIVGIGILVLFVVAVGVFAYFRKDLPNVTDISGSDLGGSISYYDRTGTVLLWQDYNGVKRVPVPGNAISQYVKDATIATEDRNFYSEHGFDLKGIARAAYVDIFHRGSTQGGSTITQQLVKLTQDFGQKRSISLKAKELILAIELERTYTKDQILTGYLNAAPYGSVDYGVQAASADYFHKSAKDLTLPEAAMLAAIPQSPAYYSPYDASTFDRAAFIERYDYVLDSMQQTGKITKAQAAAAKKYDILAEVQPQQSLYAGIQAPYFVLAAKDQLLTQFASQTSSAASKKVGGWKVITTLDMNLQNESEKLVASNLSYVERYNADEEAQVGEDVQTGQIVSLVGGVDFNNPEYGQNNYAAGIPIPPGSSFKPYDYSTLINDNNNVGAGSVLYDAVGPLPGYPCTNHSTQQNGGNCLQDYDFLSPGPETLRYALGGSRNIPAVKAMLESQPGDTSSDRAPSVNNVINTATAMMDNTYDNDHGLKTYNCYSDVKLTQPTQCYGASAIGDGA